MKTYLHNEEEVIFQIIEEIPFLFRLNSEGILPKELPDLKNRIYKYVIEGKTRYAVVVPSKILEEPYEKVYITFSVPEDGFEALIADVDGQREGDAPVTMVSRYKLACEAACEAAFEYIKDKYKDQYNQWFFTGLPKEIEKERKSMENSLMIMYGYDDDTLKRITT